jgi:hypothetical protein
MAALLLVVEERNPVLAKMAALNSGTDRFRPVARHSAAGGSVRRPAAPT